MNLPLPFVIVLVVVQYYSSSGEILKLRQLDDVLVANNTRFHLRPNYSKVQKETDLLLFISITSSPHHSNLRHANRNTWLLPCILSVYCDYRFFVDKTAPLDVMLISEQNTYNDLVFRDSCKLMDRHPDYINYGNAPPRTENFKRIENNTELASPDYLWRRLYKIDWKVCFLKYALANHKMAQYHVFVEDDSFVCTENLLHQVALLQINAQATQQQSQKQPSFRTGTAMFDGFDDSSTFMSRDVALAFAQYYNNDMGERGFNCTRLVDHVNTTVWDKAMWLSWGNSWMKERCDWGAVLKEKLNMQVIKPMVDCTTATAYAVSHSELKLEFPCMPHPIVLHHGSAGSVLLHEHAAENGHVKHTCEYMLLIDKVKEPLHMYDLWNIASVEHHFHDFSEVFLHEGALGWANTLHTLALDEQKCRKEKKSGAEAQPSVDCIFEQKRKLQEIQHKLYGRFLSSPTPETSTFDNPGAAAYFSNLVNDLHMRKQFTE